MTNTPGDGPTPEENPDQPAPSQPDEGHPQQGPSSRPGDAGEATRPQPGYWEQQAQAQQPPYPQYPQYPPPGYGAPVQYAPDHPKATTSLVLGILGVVLCQILGPFAWSMGKKTLNEIDASQGRLGGRGAAQAGYVLGIVGTVLLGLSVLLIIGYVILMVAVIGGGMATSEF
jgi:hypothetical protein